MDGVSAASSFAGLINLGLTVCNGILKYYNSWKDAEINIKGMYMSVESLTKTLLVFKRSVDHPDSHALFRTEIMSSVEECLCDCKDGINKLREKLAKVEFAKFDDRSRSERLRAHVRRAKYPFKESTLAKLRQICQDLKDDLVLAMEVLQM